MTKSVNKVRSRNFWFVLYPDDPNYKIHMENVEKLQFCAILHDRDKWNDADELKNKNHKSGELKKPHLHVFVKFPNAVWNTSLYKKINANVEDSHFNIKAIQIPKGDTDEEVGENYAYNYLIHNGDPDKYQYPVSDVFGSLTNKFREVVASTVITDTDAFILITSYIFDYCGKVTYKDLCSFAVDNNIVKWFQSHQFLVNNCMQEHNKIFNYVEEIKAREELTKNGYISVLDDSNMSF